MSVPFEIDVEREHGTEVRLNGEVVPNLADVRLRHRAGETSKLELHLNALPAQVEGEAETRFIIGGRVFVEAAEGEPLQPDDVRSEAR